MRSHGHDHESGVRFPDVWTSRWIQRCFLRRKHRLQLLISRHVKLAELVHSATERAEAELSGWLAIMEWDLRTWLDPQSRATGMEWTGPCTQVTLTTMRLSDVPLFRLSSLGISLSAGAGSHAQLLSVRRSCPARCRRVGCHRARWTGNRLCGPRTDLGGVCSRLIISSALPRIPSAHACKASWWYCVRESGRGVKLLRVQTPTCSDERMADVRGRDWQRIYWELDGGNAAPLQERRRSKRRMPCTSEIWV